MLDETESEHARMAHPPTAIRRQAQAARAAMTERAAAPVVVVYSIAQAVAALRAAVRAGRPILLVSAPEAGVYAGPGWFRALVEAAHATVPEARLSAMLDCGEQPGAALAAIRAQTGLVLFTGRPEIARRLADIARRHGVHLETKRPETALDLGPDFFASEECIEQRCAALLSCAT